MYMIRRILIGCVCLLCSVAWETVQAKKTVLSAEIYGYRAEMVYFDCFQTRCSDRSFIPIRARSIFTRLIQNGW